MLGLSGQAGRLRGGDGRVGLVFAPLFNIDDVVSVLLVFRFTALSYACISRQSRRVRASDVSDMFGAGPSPGPTSAWTAQVDL